MSHAHGGTTEDLNGPVVQHRLLLAIVVVIGLLGVAGLFFQRPTGLIDSSMGAPPSRLLDGRITAVQILDTGGDDAMFMDGVTMQITARLDSGETVSFEMSDDSETAFQVGQKVKIAEIVQEGVAPTYYISDFQRSGALLWLVGIFLATVIWFGRLQGVRAVIGLVLTLGIITQWVVPAIMDGRNPITVALAGSAVIMILTLYLSHGFHPKTTAAVVGTSAALALTGLLAWLFVRAAAITGLASEEARMATFEVSGLSLRGLLLAGIIIGGLGVLDDVTMSQASTVMELRRANPAARFAELMRGGLAVGRDHIAATVNTLFLAYAGASLPLLLLFSTSRDSLGNILTSEVIAVEIVRTLVGSIGLIAAVPLTTALAAALSNDRPQAG